MRAMQFAILACLTMLFCAPGAHAQMYHSDYGTVGAPMSSFLSSSYLSQKVLNDTNFRKRATAPSAKPASAKPIIVSAKEKSTALEALVQTYPADSRPQMRVLFSELLKRYSQVEQGLNMRRGDLSGAVASYIAFSYMGYRGGEFPEQHFPALLAQMQGALSAAPALAKASEAEKRDLYDRLVMNGMFIAAVHTALKEKPNPAIEAKMRVAAGSYLKALLNVEPGRVRLGAAGLTVAG